ncbi:LacI family DNA-binding transcriptional regulator [Thermobispora bispora]|jgi:LacI family transcriptional regulator|uniref:Transcriptional regulator, LacI family n=1 Tax=Thermobispora bispora (strain ATCC 19993 / DSM 43833 / CBS 139.67 / JCM 10125 / KCTC 9307 / NBRC 14880 / R51) TaxID=469371 RepID=D6Y3S8_THEBD|nr:LacI family DNA-binding transcriptional regulator [Thermobispora bispora]MBO2475647.1 LacI family transcriptional regulator [Actinomycetales bacterium]MDI9581397.1 LacI family DNA-binding transcriptional regulator [Thermobispora sp.]ADG89030.1 transcriptional regulator, LacI family [Thermobispora bispora DSM 43833]MBX6166508.1 LacI family DNA-binding transcriptional regulator [Thermobispora bispora]QSI48758.1 LacI family transcriptional regulator [Thermobispora bispora]
MPAKRRVTIAQIAQEARVSVPTVSKVINGRPEVAPETRQRVERLLQKHGYQRRTGLGDRPVGLLDLVFAEIESPWAMELVRGVETVAREAGASVVISVLHTHAGPGRDWLERIAARRTDGVIIVGSRLSTRQRGQLIARSIPFVVVDPEGEPAPAVASVGATNWHGGLEATRHLLELGHRRIGVIGGPPDMLCSRARIDGYRAALETAGIPVDPELIRYGDFLVNSGHDQGHELLSLPEPPTAIFAGCDMQAFGVFEAARQRGLRVPEDLSVIGFDDLPLSQWAWPPLTTIRQPLQEMAALAARMVLAMGRGEEVEARRIELATELVVRESTAPPRTGDQ